MSNARWKELNCSGLGLLERRTTTPENIQILTKYLDRHPELYLTFSATALAWPISTHDPDGLTHLHQLSNFNEGILLLQRIFNFNPEIAEYFSIGALLHSVTPINNSPMAYCPLHGLTFHKIGMPVLKKIFQANPQYFTDITADVLSSPSIGGYTPLHGFTKTPQGFNLLMEIIKHNPILSETITAEILCKTTTTLLGASPLAFIFEDPSELSLLELLFTKQPHLEEEIASLLLTPTHPNNFVLGVAASFEGKKFIKTCLDKYPNLTLNMRADFLTYEFRQGSIRWPSLKFVLETCREGEKEPLSEVGLEIIEKLRLIPAYSALLNLFSPPATSSESEVSDQNQVSLCQNP